MTTITQPQPTIEPLTITAEPDTQDGTCYVCGGLHYTECEGCDKITCKEHTREYVGWCQVQRTLCPLCDAEKRRESNEREAEYRRWEAEL